MSLLACLLAGEWLLMGKVPLFGDHESPHEGSGDLSIELVHIEGIKMRLAEIYGITEQF